ncbi:unnamed protein product [Paramecium sonneborni]|uniref:Transmembrane protein n=1 Tax=Paramecium sonneborni TaxID=65129 RepID=A0A8S1RVR1_9CILI|nr:unnamed protein product [Paramecium sonneborni]
MIIILLEIYGIWAFCLNQYTRVQDISLYPTVGEFYSYYLESFLSETQLMCKMHPQVPNVQLINQCKKISQIKGNQFKSMSSNTTHFGTLTNNNEVIIYEWKNQRIQQIGQYVPIDSSFNCYNILLSKDFSILIDCYYNNEFFLIQLIDEQSIITYQIEAIAPTKTKIQSLQMEQMLLQYMHNILKIIQYYLYFHYLFLIKVAQITILSILISQLQQVQIFMQLLLKRFSNYLYLQMVNFIKKLILLIILQLIHNVIKYIYKIHKIILLVIIFTFPAYFYLDVIITQQTQRMIKVNHPFKIYSQIINLQFISLLIKQQLKKNMQKFLLILVKSDKQFLIIFKF